MWYKKKPSVDNTEQHGQTAQKRKFVPRADQSENYKEFLKILMPSYDVKNEKENRRVDQQQPRLSR
ncbi:MAG: hypothetical protein ACD_21C00055G0005 [uncultured bacterium]|nr:MAG: hypothetical protein ACD_21C00055G0005 [uncultured bacterium]